jgi:hypothetical protein
VDGSKPLRICGVGVFFAVLFATSSLCAQGNRFALGGGASLPTGKFSELANVGWHATGSLNFGRQDSRLGLLIDGTSSEFGFDVKRAGSEASRFNPYVIGGGGVYNSKGIGDDASLFGDDSSTDFGLNAGLGLNYTVSRVVLYLEGRYHTVFTDADDSHFIPVTLGIRFGR